MGKAEFESDFVYKKDGFSIPIKAIYNDMTEIEQEAFVAFIRQYAAEAQTENIKLKADIVYAIGQMQGLGYPSAYLEREYPELKEQAGA